MQDIVRKHIFVSGRVQGVWFRGSTETEANRLGVAGWVRNLPDGRVEAVFEGSGRLVDAAVGWCRTGPEYAIVDSVEIEEEPPEGLGAFEVR
jgi:acylphosphatase